MAAYKNQERPCSTCGKIEPEVSFYTRADNGYRRSQCTECYRKARLEYNQQNRETINKHNRSNYWSNLTYEETRRQKYREANKDKLLQYFKTYYQNNKEMWIVKAHSRRVRLSQSKGAYTLQEWEELKSIYDYRCLSCRRCEPVIKLTVDHVVPISKGGSNYITNIQPLCKSCNSRKHNKEIDYRFLARTA